MLNLLNPFYDMKKYMIPSTEAVELQGERMMVEVGQSMYDGESYAPARS